MLGIARAFLITLLCLTACAGNPNEVGELVPYINTTFGFRVEYPSNWQVLEDPPVLVGDAPGALHAVTFAPDAAAGVLFTVLIQDLGAAHTLDEYSAEQMAGIQRNAGGAQYSNLQATRLGGRDALETTGVLDENGRKLEQRVVLAVNGARGYGVSIVAPQDSPLLTTLDEMLASFGLLP
jgi:hypothetical protein